ncbi:hypothetical protein TIFTF001_040566 [Ficus carica]|uniref:Disease resistance R13L4/SHOC-2-like LRR domain-containing protein n=1 Tax=Ficus carica TaxID=3494 RepID=A0AA87ZDX7_FICCA|nr:hypothetical protein TIFTF001_040566 [Ficus carica]
MLSRWSTTTFRCDPIFNLTCLRSLILYCCGLRQLPKEIGNLIHLRFLNVTGNSFLKEFPDTLCDLLNLQTLKMNECISFERLPKRIEKLVKLRHLYIFGCECLKGLPKGIEKLTCLRKLDTFFVPYQDFEADEALKLEDLNRLKHLQWSNVVVFRCANLTNGGQAEGELLKKKQDLVDLKLVFEWPQKQYQRSDEDEVILEALHPHPNLKSLEIGSYRGANISPSWLNALCNLKMLKLKYCDF